MISILLGTRPEIIKLSPIIRLMESTNKTYSIIHTNQHYSKNMDGDFFESLNIKKPDFNLNVKERLGSAMISEVIVKSENVLKKIKPNLLIVQGDTNSVLGGALSAIRLGIPVAHVEAGLRSYDDTMPEEINRRLTDHVSEYLFCPTIIQKQTLIKEGVNKNKIFVTGNTVVDAVYENIKISQSRKLPYGNYLLLTLHRPSNVDNRDVLEGILKSILFLSQKLNLKVFFPIHPRTLKTLKANNIVLDKNVFLESDPVDYLDMLNLEKNAKMIITDSGGVQEEACILGIPCVTVRDNTERPETVDVGANIIAGTTYEGIIKSSFEMLDRSRGWKNPFGDGKSAQKIIKIIDQSI